MSSTRVSAVAAFATFLAACQPADLGPCDLEAATSPIYYDPGGLPAYPGQALVDTSCGAASFCHTQGIDPTDRYAAPLGLDLDVAVAIESVDGADLERLRHARRVAWNLRHAMFAQVESGAMPPPDEAGAAARNAGTRRDYLAFPLTPEQRPLPAIDSPEGVEMLRNWLACGAQVIEATAGESTGIGDIAPAGVARSSCGAGQALCTVGGVETCIDVSSDSANCGACGFACSPTDQACVAGACTCLNGLDACGASCVDVHTDVANCGACGASCGLALFCVDSSCVDSCPLTDCGGSCVDTSTSLAHCGSCSNPCAPGHECAGGACVCAAGYTACSPTLCANLDTDPANCGACGNACAGGTACVSGSCACPSPTMLCGGTCIDTSTDAANCGGCGRGCAAGDSCTAGTCVGCGPAVGFASDIQSILTTSCAVSTCHSGVRPQAGLDLSTGRAYSQLVGQPASCGSNILVTPGDVDRSYLMNKLTGVGMACGGSQMPKRGTSLPSAQLDLIRSWICRGAANN